MQTNETSSDDTATSTRVFVSGLPPTFTSDDLRKHFGQRFSVTDAHVLSDRRIGFVGLPDHEAAQNAVKYFNKSFIRMSKISAALAKPVDVSRDASGQAAPVSQKQEKLQSARKRKREQRDDGEQQRQSAVPSTTAQNNGAATTPVVPTDEEEEFHGFGSDDEAFSAEEADSSQTPLTDSDWLRGKTSRTLDLQDPDAEALLPQAAQQLPSPVSPDRSPLPEPRAEGDGLLQDPNQSANLLEVPNGRLFVRNLPFSAREDDLEQLFATFGKLEEVSNSLFCQFLSCFP
jgi:multiple RNA-binding domain-containing protein 1